MSSNEVLNFLNTLTGKECCRKRVGEYGTLSIGFGEKIFHNKPNHLDNFYGEWEIGTYRASWRIVSEKTVLLGSRDLPDDSSSLDKMLEEIFLGKIKHFDIGHFDIRVHLDNNIIIEFFCCSNDDDDIFHIMDTKKTYFGFNPQNGWTIEK